MTPRRSFVPVLSIDDREPETVQTFLYARMHGIGGWEVEVKRMEVSDYSVSNRLGIERKTPEDFLGSFSSNRLQAQCHELHTNFELAVLLIPGNPNEVISNRFRGFSDAAVRGMLASLIVRAGVLPLFCGANGWMEMIEALARKVEDGKGLAYNPVRPKATDLDLRVNVLTSFPGVGVERARAILAHYGSLQDALEAVVSWPKEIEGVGEKTAETVAGVFTSR
jgi:ERCC4-type nuclease